MEHFLVEYPDIMKEALLPMFIALLTITIPLLVGTISRIDDKYNSTKLIEAFKKEKVCLWYVISVCVSIFAYVIWLLHIPRIVDLGCCNVFIDYSAVILVALSTIFLIIMTLCIVWIIFVYYVPDKLLKHLIKKYNNLIKNKQFYFESISKLMIYAIRAVDIPLRNKIFKFYEECVSKFYEKPHIFYHSLYEINEYLFTGKDSTIKSDDKVFDLILKDNINETTLDWLWIYLRQALYHNREDVVLGYWRKTHQKAHDIRITISEKQQETFLEFHYVLGGLLMYLKKYELVKAIMNWSHSCPPEYVLVPETMDEVIQWYMKITHDKYDSNGQYNFIYYEEHYPFPNNLGVNPNNVIVRWVQQYIAVLFLRQYTLPEYQVEYSRLEFSIPTKEALPENWEDELLLLGKFIEKHINNQELLSKLVWPKRKIESNTKETPPSELIQRLKEQIKESFQE